MGWGYYDQFRRQADWSQMVSPTTAEALRQSPDATGYVTNASSMGLWVAALEHKPVAWTWTHEPPPEYTEADAQVRCVLGWVNPCDWHAATVALGVSHVVVDTRFPFTTPGSPPNYLAPPDQWRVTADASWLTLVYEQGTTRMWRIEPTPS